MQDLMMLLIFLTIYSYLSLFLYINLYDFLVYLTMQPIMTNHVNLNIDQYDEL